MKTERSLILLVLSLFLALFFVRCGSEKGVISSSQNEEKLSFTKAGKIGRNDFPLNQSVNEQNSPSLAYDQANNRILAVWTEVKATGKDIKGRWIFIKKQTSGTQSYSFPVSIANVIAFDSNDIETVPQSLSGLTTSSITVTAPTNTTLLFFSNVFDIQTNVADKDKDQTPNPVVSFGSDYAGNQNFIVIWSDYKNDGGSISSPKLVGKVYNKNCAEVRKFYVAGTANSFYTYSATIYNLKNDVSSKGQFEPAVAFDNNNKRFVVAWVDKNTIENNYRLAPREDVLSSLTNSLTTESPIFNSLTNIVDDRMVVYRYFDVNGNPLKDPNDISNRRSIVLYSDIDVESSSISEDIKLSLNNIKSFKFETSPKVAFDNQGNLLVAFIGKQFVSSAFFNYSSDSFPNNYISRGPFSSSVTSSSSSSYDIFIRDIKPNKDMEGKLYISQLRNPDKAVASADVDSFDIINLSGTKFAIAWSQNDGGIYKVKINTIDMATFSLATPFDVTTDKKCSNPKLTLISNELFVVYERYDSDRAISSIYGRYLLPNLTADTDNFKISTGTGTKNLNPSITSDDSGIAIILFEDDRNNGTLNIFGTLYTRKQPLVKPILFLPYTSLDFGTVYIDSTNKKYLSINNYGNGNLNITGATIASPFQTISSVQTISPNSTGYIGVKFTPTQVGNFTTTLNLTTDDTIRSSVNVTVRGTAKAGVIIDISQFVDKADLKSDYYAKLTATTPGQLQTNYEWTVVKGALPDGISLDKNTGVLSGKATKTGTFEFEVKARETNSGLTSPSIPLKIVVYDDLAYAEKGSFNCFIATAAYGSYLDPHVAVLRNFRDRVLLGTLSFNLFGKSVVIENYPGKIFVKNYYKYSPPIAKFIAKSEFLRATVRILLTPLILLIKYLKVFLFFGAITAVYFLRKK